MRGLRVLGVMLIVAVAVSAAGCARVADSLKPRPNVVVIEATVASVDATISGGTLAPGRPSSTPLWPGSRLVSSAQTQTPQGKSWTASFTTSDEFDDVVKGLAVGLENAGWTTEVADASVGGEQTSLLSAATSSTDALFTVARSADASVTSIDVVITPKR